MRCRWLVMAALCGACEMPEPLDLIETGWFEDDGIDHSRCPDRVDDTVPADGAEGWYWRAPLTLYSSTDAPVVEARLTAWSGAEVPLTRSVDDTGLVHTLSFEGGLAPNTEHVLEVTDCTGTREVRFTTSSLGTPLVDGQRTIARRTYRLNLVDATWYEPGGFGPVLAGLLETPILLGVQYVDATVVDWLGAPGISVLGNLRQDTGKPTWDFPVADFSEAPFFQTSADTVDLDVQGFPLVINDFYLEGTFSADGATFEHATLQGLADSRYAGGAVGGAGDPDALCNLAAGLGVDCVPCPDGLPVCFEVDVRAITAVPVADVTLVPVR